MDLMHSSRIREGKTPTFNCTQCAFRHSTEYWLAIWGLSYSQVCQMMPWRFLLPLTSTWTPCSLVVIGGLSPPTSFGTYGATLLCSFIINVVHGILVLFLLYFYVGIQRDWIPVLPLPMYFPIINFVCVFNINYIYHLSLYHKRLCPNLITHLLFLSVAQTVKRLPTMQETWVRSLGWEDPLEKGM